MRNTNPTKIQETKTRNTNPTKIQEPQHSKLKRRGTGNQNTRTTTQQHDEEHEPTKIQEPQHSKLKRRGTRTPPKYKNHNTAN